MNKNQRIRSLYRHYKQETGSQIVDMKEFAKWMQRKGYPMPTPLDPLDLLAKQCADAIREETRRDSTSGLPYKANLAFTPDGTGQVSLWVDVDEAPRKVVHKCLIQRRDQMVGEAYQLTLIQDHWNSIHPTEEPLDLPLDFKPDVDWKKNGGDEQVAAA